VINSVPGRMQVEEFVHRLLFSATSRTLSWKSAANSTGNMTWGVSHTIPYHQLWTLRPANTSDQPERAIVSGWLLTLPGLGSEIVDLSEQNPGSSLLFVR
jgi:hypothetical protein